MSAPMFSYAQAAKGLAPAVTIQSSPRNESPAASEKSAKERPTAESTSVPASTKPSKSTTLESDTRAGPEDGPARAPGHAVSKDEGDAEQHHPRTRTAAGEHEETSTAATVTSDAAQETSGRPTDRQSAWDNSTVDTSRDKSSDEKRSSKEADDEWEKVSLPPAAPEKELKPAPIPTMNIWQQRIEVYAAKQKELAGSQRPSAPAVRPKTVTEEPKRKATKEAAMPKESKPADSARTKDRKETPATRPSRPVSQYGERAAASSEVPPPVGDAQSWPTPETATTDERRKSSTLERNEKTDVKSSEKKDKKLWEKMDFVPSVKFETQIPSTGSRRGGRSNTRGGRDSNGRGGHNASTPEKSDASAGMGPPPLPQQSTDQDRGRRQDGQRGARGASVPINGNRPCSGDDPAGSQQAPSDVHGAAPVYANGEDFAQATAQSSRSSSQAGRGTNRNVNGEFSASGEQASGAYAPVGADHHSRPSYSFDRSKSSYSRGGAEFARDRPPRREWNKDKPDSAREKVQSWRDRDAAGDQTDRRESRSERGRGGYRGRGGNHSYSSNYNSTHAYTSPLPQNGFEPSKSASHGEPRSRQTSQPFQSSQSSNPSRSNPRSQSIPVGMMFPGYYNGMPNMHPQGLQPLQTDMQVYSYPSPLHMPPGIMTAMPYNDPLNSYALLSMVMTQIEYYFSIDNLCKDLFLRKHMDSQGYVPLNVIANFKRIKALTEDNMTIETLRYVCQQVKSVEYLPGPDGDDRLRRRENWRDFILPMEERLESARNDGPTHPPEMFSRATHDQPGPVDPSFGINQMRSPPLSMAGPNGGFPTMSTPTTFIPGMMDGPPPNMPFPSPFDDGSQDPARRPSFPQDSLTMRSPASHTAMPPLLNGHHRQPSRSDYEDNLFPDESIPHINIRMQPRNLDGSRDLSQASSAAGPGSNEAGGVTNGDAQGTQGTQALGLRGGASSPQQLDHPFRSMSFGFTGATPLNGDTAVIYFTKDGQETQLPPPGPGEYDQTYESLREVALRERELGDEEALEPLYAFWSNFLVGKFNIGMYQEFKTSALNDAQQGQESGKRHLLGYYSKLLAGPIPISERLASDMVTLVREEKPDSRPAFHALRAAWRNGATNLKSIKRLREVLTPEEKTELDKSG